MQIVWRVDSGGVYTANWEIPLDAPAGVYDIVVTANHYALTSAPFSVVPSTRVVLRDAGAGQVHAGYPAAVENIDITARPVALDGGTLAGRAFSGAVVAAAVVPAGAVLDAFGNCNGSAFGQAGSVTTCPSPAGAANVGDTGSTQALTPAIPNTAAASAVAGGGAAAAVALLMSVPLGRRARRRAARRAG